MWARGLTCLASAIVLLAGAAGFPDAQDEPGLKDLVPSGMLIGAAVSQTQIEGGDPLALAIVGRHFNSITPENLLKWGLVHPEPDRYNFEPADRYVAFGRERGMTVIGHTLVWHRQTPDWVFAENPALTAGAASASRETLLARMRAHIETVVGRYRGRIQGWDVVNEALNDDGSWRRTPWFEILGEEFVIRAFEFAHRADPQAGLYYNDYDLWKPGKRAGALRIVRMLRDRGLRIDGVGEQGHWALETPTIPEIDATIGDLARGGVRVMITELDVDLLPRRPEMLQTDRSDAATQAKFREATDVYTQGLPDDVDRRLAARYGEIFALVVRRRAEMTRVTFWGVHDAQSWLNNFPVRGRTNHPLLWDRQGRPKAAFAATVAALRGR
jgi:endo-1,4-beta-xylanase